MDARQHTYPEGDYPPRVVRYWTALERHWASGTRQAPTLMELGKKYDPVVSERTVERDRRAHPDLVGSWPPKRSERPPWELPPAEPLSKEPIFNVDDSERRYLEYSECPVIVKGKPAIRVDEFDVKTHQVVRSYIDFHSLAACLVVSVATVLDMMSGDGAIDHIINWCQLGISHVVR